MKILKIEGNKGFFNTAPNEEWKPIDQISKDDLLLLLNCYIENEVEMDVYEESSIQNQAQQIIYKSLFDKFSTLNSNKSKFKDESERLYLNEIQKYKTATSAPANAATSSQENKPS